MPGLYPQIVYRLAGDRGLLAELGDAIDPEVNRRVRSLALALDREPPQGIVEFIPTYRSLLILYDPLETDPDRLRAALDRLGAQADRLEAQEPAPVEIPVAYGGEFGPDLEFVAQHAHLSPEEVVRRHSEPVYHIYMLGFTPGFPFLGGLPEPLRAPRLQTPRVLVPAGSVAIANDQTGIYPIDSPGGWQLIGRTPLKLFDPGRAEPFLLRAGGRLKFKPIPAEEYRRLAGQGGQ